MRNRNPLTDEQLRSAVPSAFAIQPYEGMSSKYAFIPTSRVIDAMRGNGYLPTEANQSVVRLPGKTPFAKHLIRFSATAWNPTLVGEEALEVVLINSHDGSSAYKLMLGIIRFACTNGLIVADGTVESISVRHSGNIVDDVLNASVSLIENGTKVQDRIVEWKGISVSDLEAKLFAEQAVSLRYDEASPITPAQALTVRRREDQANNLWTVFNRVQENLTQGGIVPRDENGRRRTTLNAETGQTRRVPKTRPVKGINENVKLNRALFALAEGFATLKTGNQ